MSTGIGRRTFVSGSATVAGAAALTPLPTACGGSASSQGGTSSRKGVKAALPAYAAGSAAQPDIPLYRSCAACAVRTDQR